MVQYPRDELGGLPDLKDEENHGDGQVQHAGITITSINIYKVQLH